MIKLQEDNLGKNIITYIQIHKESNSYIIQTTFLDGTNMESVYPTEENAQQVMQMYIHDLVNTK